MFHSRGILVTLQSSSGFSIVHRNDIIKSELCIAGSVRLLMRYSIHSDDDVWLVGCSGGSIIVNLIWVPFTAPVGYYDGGGSNMFQLLNFGHHA